LITVHFLFSSLVNASSAPIGIPAREKRKGSFLSFSARERISSDVNGFYPFDLRGEETIYWAEKWGENEADCGDGGSGADCL
jgi:hypothetical protein